METNEEKDAPKFYDDIPVKGPADSTSVKCSESVKKQINDKSWAGMLDVHVEQQWTILNTEPITKPSKMLLIK